jgi:hypothetical protein
MPGCCCMPMFMAFPLSQDITLLNHHRLHPPQLTFGTSSSLSSTR